MRATIIHGPGDIRVEEREYPTVLRGSDAVVRVSAACVCGSDLWPYRGIRETPEPRAIGHEFVGVVESVGADVASLAPGDFVIAPFTGNCGKCPPCRSGVTVACEELVGWGSTDTHGDFVQGAQGEAVRVPNAEATLVKVPGVSDPGDELLADLLTLSDVMGTGHHAAVSAGVSPGATVVVVGDGAVGLCAVLAASRLGTGRIIAMSRHEDRAALAREFGATDVVAERGKEGAARVRELLGGVPADAVLECVGTAESMDQALRCTRPGGRVGFVGVPAGGAELPIGVLFAKNITVGGGMAPVRTYLPELLEDVLAGKIRPGKVFDSVLPLDDAPKGYAAMDQRQSVKVMLKP